MNFLGFGKPSRNKMASELARPDGSSVPWSRFHAVQDNLFKLESKLIAIQKYLKVDIVEKDNTHTNHRVITSGDKQND